MPLGWALDVSLKARQGTMLGVLYALGHALEEYSLVLGMGLAAFGAAKYLAGRRQPMVKMLLPSLVPMLIGLMFVGLYYMTEIEF
ncbi:hypothetical protein [Candidatus Synchoanobacter obligatus]|uniref:Uncharacterized protein n=1 Tax=Candidatus Synchoanobacter obligatus TaxID=2919597 RepID=A0ABT1L6Q6_9GAMM|nr:hypothetical protein [Candidatus Synchoanobacter obligatus]MCP8352533.1 hypothetical protein [Candidatus Synchoanobacter obligatus]